MDLEIVPYRGVGLVRFGMSKDEVRSLLGPPDKELIRNPQFAPDHVEWIYDRGRVYYTFDRSQTCVEIMLTPPAEALLAGTRLLGVGAAEAWRELRRMDPTAFVDESGCLTSKALGLNIYAPDVGTELEEPGFPALSVLVFSDPDDERLQGPSPRAIKRKAP